MSDGLSLEIDSCLGKAGMKRSIQVAVRASTCKMGLAEVIPATGMIVFELLRGL